MSKESAKSCRRLEERGGQLLGLFAGHWRYFEGEIPRQQASCRRGVFVWLFWLGGRKEGGGERFLFRKGR